MKRVGPAYAAKNIWQSWLSDKPPPRPRLGDTDAVGSHLIRLGKNAETAAFNDFGVYLGLYQGKHVVGVKDPDRDDPGKPNRVFISTEYYDSRVELESDWTFDNGS